MFLKLFFLWKNINLLINQLFQFRKVTDMIFRTRRRRPSSSRLPTTPTATITAPRTPGRPNLGSIAPPGALMTRSKKASTAPLLISTSWDTTRAWSWGLAKLENTRKNWSKSTILATRAAKRSANGRDLFISLSPFRLNPRKRRIQENLPNLPNSRMKNQENSLMKSSSLLIFGESTIWSWHISTLLPSILSHCWLKLAVWPASGSAFRSISGSQMLRCEFDRKRLSASGKRSACKSNWRHTVSFTT